MGDKSSCCGGDVYWIKHWLKEYPEYEHDFIMIPYCSKCRKPTVPQEEKANE